MQARWNPPRPTPTQPAQQSHSARRTPWKPRLAGLLAAGALALGVLAAGSDTCVASETFGTGSYSQSTLAPITASRADRAASARGTACRHRHKAGRFAQPKTARNE